MSSDPDAPALGAGAAAAGAQQALEVLDVVAVLVGDDVRPGERPARGAEPRLELVEEAEVEIDRLVGRAVERPDGRGRRPAAGVDAAVVDDRLGRAGTSRRPGRTRPSSRPGCCSRTRRSGSPPARCAWAPVRHSWVACEPIGARTPPWGTAPRSRRVAAEQQVDDGDDEPDAAAADGDSAASAVPATADVGDLVGVESGPWIECHVWLPPDPPRWLAAIVGSQGSERAVESPSGRCKRVATVIRPLTGVVPDRIWQL